MKKLLFIPVLLALLLGFGISAQAQDIEQLRKLIETMDLPEEEETTETTEEAEEQPFDYEEYMKQFNASQEAAHPGVSEGWPGADAFQNWGITMTQPAGTEARHNYDGYSLEVFLKCQNMDAAVQDLVKQAEAATNKKAEANKNEHTYDAEGNQYTSTNYHIYMEGKRFDWNITVRQSDGYVVLWISNSAQ
jgi:hypothetical protein